MGTPRDEIWDERVYGLQTLIDDHLAVVWAPYSFYRGEQFSHCGVNAFTLLEREDGWKILHIADTRRQDGCLNEG